MNDCKLKCFFKWVGIAVAIAGAAAAVYFVVSKHIAKKKAAEDETDFHSCICFDDELDGESSEDNVAE